MLEIWDSAPANILFNDSQVTKVLFKYHAFTFPRQEYLPAWMVIWILLWNKQKNMPMGRLVETGI